MKIYKALRLAFYRVIWLSWDENERKPWDQVVSCLDHNKHTYDGEIMVKRGMKFQKCSHYGCSVYNPID